MLKVLVLTPGRSGTKSMHAVLEGLCRANGCDWVIQHQTEQGLVTRAAEDAILRGDTSRAREVYAGWTHAVEVSGNNNAFLVPVMKAVFGADLKIIRLLREPEAHLRSLATGPAVSPEVWGGYHDGSSTYDGPIYWDLPTAPWFGEMSADAWQALPTYERVRWYLETLQAWMDKGADLFEQRIDVRTEELSQPETIDRIARFLDPTWEQRTEPVHKNTRAMFDYGRLTAAEVKEARRLFEQFDFQRVLHDPAYLLAWSVEKALEASQRPISLLTDLEGQLRDLRARLQAAESSLRAYQRRLESDPHDESSFCGMMQALLSLDRTQDALELASAWLPLHPDYVPALELAAEAADRLSQAESAREYRERARALASA